MRAASRQRAALINAGAPGRRSPILRCPGVTDATPVGRRPFGCERRARADVGQISRVPCVAALDRLELAARGELLERIGVGRLVEAARGRGAAIIHRADCSHHVIEQPHQADHDQVDRDDVV